MNIICPFHVAILWLWYICILKYQRTISDLLSSSHQSYQKSFIWVTASLLRSSAHYIILADLNTVVWIVPSSSLISNDSNLLSKLLETVQSKPIITGISDTRMVHCFPSSLARSKYLSLFSFSFIYTLWFAWTAKSTIWQILSFSLSLYYH